MLARADGPFDGAWQAGPTRIQVNVQSWGSDCGPRPQSITSRGGGTVRISTEGDHLVFRGARTNRTDACWSENSAVRRVAMTAQAGQWRTVCRTPSGDSRGETGTYTLRASNPNTLDFRDESEYDWQLNASRCQATITTTQSFTRSTGNAPPAPPPPPPPPPPPEPQVNTACTPGAPARIAVFPATTTVAPGARVCFRAHVTDAANCAVRGANVAFTLEGAGQSGGALRDACFTAGSNGAASEGEFRVVGSSGALRDAARVRVRLSDLSDLIARRGEEGLFGTDTEAAAPATPEDTVHVAATAAPAESSGTSATLIAILSGLLLVVAVGVFFFVLRRKKASAPSAAPMDDGEWPTASVQPPAPVNTENMICPVCRRGYAPTDTTCTHDGATLLRYSDFVAQSKATEEMHGKSKLCPKCGERYPMSSTFCGKDGTTLIVPK